MADRYVRSTTGNNANAGTSWALAKADIQSMAAALGANNVLNVSQVHAETAASLRQWLFSGLLGSPQRCICANDGAAPPTATATSATVATTGASDLEIYGSPYIAGLQFSIGSGSSTASLKFGMTVQCMQVYESCQFTLGNTSSSSRLGVNSAAQNKTRWLNCDVKFGNSTQAIYMVAGGEFHWKGGSVLAGGTSPSTLIKFAGATPSLAKVLVENVDLSNLGTSVTLADIPDAGVEIKFLRCKVPASWTGAPALIASFTQPGRVEAWGCANATHDKLWIVDCFGTIVDESTIVRTGGAAHDGTAISWKMTANGRSKFFHGNLESPPLFHRIKTSDVGVSKTAAVECIFDSGGTFTNQSYQIILDYFSASGSPLGSWVSNRPANFLSATSSTNLTSSSATWTTTGMSSPNKVKLEVTFTPQKEGYITARIIAIDTTPFYVDPIITLT